MLSSTHIRPTAQVIIEKDDAVLVQICHDKELGTFVRLPGGGIEFGETAEEALHREMMEELGCGASQPKLLGVVENIYDWRGSKHHEIIFVFRAKFSDETFYAKEKHCILDTGDNAEWIKREDILNGRVAFYPVVAKKYL